MPGYSDYAAENVLAYLTGRQAMPALPSVFVALFTTAPTSDAGTGGTEVSTSSTAYARVQVAGALAAGAAFTTASSTITLGATAPAWLLALGTNGSGVNVYDATNSQQIGTVSSISGTTVTLTANAAHASSGAADSLVFSAFGAPSASSGTEPSVTPSNITNGASITFALSTAAWGTAVAFGLYDAATAGNYLAGDYLGNFKWLPFSCSLASPGVLTVDNAADAYPNGTPVVVTSKYGGTLPTTGGSFAGVLTTAGLSGATFNVGVNTTSLGGGMIREVLQQVIPNNNTVSFAASTLTVQGA